PGVAGLGRRNLVRVELDDLLDCGEHVVPRLMARRRYTECPQAIEPRLERRGDLVLKPDRHLRKRGWVGMDRIEVGGRERAPCLFGFERLLTHIRGACGERLADAGSCLARGGLAATSR